MEERRKFMRFDVALNAFQLHEIFGDFQEKIKSRLRNVSREGLRLFAENALAKGTIIKLRVEVPGDNLPMSVFSEVIWSKKISPDGYDTGMRFTEIRDEDRTRLIDYAYNTLSRAPHA